MMCKIDFPSNHLRFVWLSVEVLTHSFGTTVFDLQLVYINKPDPDVTLFICFWRAYLDEEKKPF